MATTPSVCQHPPAQLPLIGLCDFCRQTSGDATVPVTEGLRRISPVTHARVNLDIMNTKPWLIVGRMTCSPKSAHN